MCKPDLLQTCRATITRMIAWAIRVLVVSLFLVTTSSAEPYRWMLPEGFRPPPVPADNPMTEQKVLLGRYLFYDRRLSGNGTQACGSCHQQKLAFTDGRSRAVGSTGQQHSRGSMSLVNIAWTTRFTWANSRLRQLEDQIWVPMFGTEPVELGLEPDLAPFFERIKGEDIYGYLFARAFPEDADPMNLYNVIRAIACFERSIVSARSIWDEDWRQVRHLYGFERDFSLMSESAQRGEVLFFSKRLACGECHGGPLFGGALFNDGLGRPRRPYHNNGLTSGDAGLATATGRASDFGKFKAPTLRNIALTAPYMHDGSIATLATVIDKYASGGYHVPGQSSLVRGFPLSDRDRADLVAFLESLTDEDVTKDPRFADPWAN
jgi:cytochrome c peroxidase